MPAAVPIAIAVMAGSSIASMVEQNQQVQHAKGAAQAQQDQMNSQLVQQQKTDQQSQTAKQDTAKSTQAQAIAAIRAAMTTNGAMGGTILTGPQGAAAAPTQGKTLLGQ